MKMKRLNAILLKSAMAAAVIAGSASFASAAASVASVSVGQAPSAAPSPSAAAKGGPSPVVFTKPIPRIYRRPRPCHGNNCAVPRKEQYSHVCFYTSSYFGGAKFCNTAGTMNPHLSRRWNNKISSVRVIGPANVKICSGNSLSGECYLISSDRPLLNSLDNVISSFAIR
jgi:hypothetical protein